MLLRDAAEPLANAVLGTAFGEPITAVVGGIGLIKRLLPSDDLQKRVRKLTKRLADSLPEDQTASEREVVTAGALLRYYAHIAPDLASLGNDASRVTDAILRRGAALLADHDDDAGRHRIRVMVECYVAALRDDPDVVTEVNKALHRLTHEAVARIAGDLERQGDALATLAASVGRRLAFPILSHPAVDPARVGDDADLGPAQLLNAIYEVVPFRGRTRELQVLRDFLQAEGDTAALVIEGEGGLGKTRLAMEFVRLAQRDGWRAGFLTASASGHVLQGGLAEITDTDRDALIVVDYGEDRPEQVAEIVQAWVTAPATTRRRLLILVRKKSLLSERLQNVRGTHRGLQAAVDFLGGARVRALGTADLRIPPDERADAFRDAQAHFAARRGSDIASLPPPPDTLTRDDKDYRHLGLPLYLHMAALASLDGRADLRKTDLLNVVLDRTWQYANALLRADTTLSTIPLKQRHLEDVLTVATLALAARPPTNDTAPDAAACLAITPLGRTLNEVQALDFCAFLNAAFASDTSGLDAVQPDAVGEGLVFRSVAPGSLLLDGVLAMDFASAQSACMVLVRAALALSDNPDAWLRARMPPHQLPDSIAIALYTAIPDTTVGLRKFAVDVAERGLPVSDDVPDERRAWALNTLGHRYGALGYWEDALAATTGAVEIYDRLAVCSPDAFEPDLASAFNNLSILLNEIDRQEEALAITTRAVEIYDRLAARNPDAFEPYLSSALTNLGIRLDAIGQRKEALAATTRAVEIRERLAARNPDAFEPNLAITLTNLGNRLDALGLREEALAATKRSVEIYDRLAARNPDSFEPGLGLALNNLGVDCQNAGRLEEALTTIMRAVEIRERLFARNPDAFQPDLATTLGVLGQIHWTASNEVEACRCFERGLWLIHRFVITRPATFGPVAMALLQGYLDACEDTETTLEVDMITEIARALGLDGEPQDDAA